MRAIVFLRSNIKLIFPFTVLDLDKRKLGRHRICSGLSFLFIFRSPIEQPKLGFLASNKPAEFTF